MLTAPVEPEASTPIPSSDTAAPISLDAAMGVRRARSPATRVTRTLA